MKRHLLFLLVLTMCVTMCACDSSTTFEKDTTISSPSDAIYAVKTDINTEWRICDGLGYKFCKEPNYGTCTASKNSDGSWNVTLHGNMWGYYDDEKIDLDHCGFVLTATVDEDGTILSSNVKKTS